MEPRTVDEARPRRTLPGVVLSQRRAAAGAHAGRLDPGGPVAGAISASVTQGSLGQCPWQVGPSDDARSGVALGRSGFRDRARDGARAGAGVLRTVGVLWPA